MPIKITSLIIFEMLMDLLISRQRHFAYAPMFLRYAAPTLFLSRDMRLLMFAAYFAGADFADAEFYAADAMMPSLFLLLITMLHIFA